MSKRDVRSVIAQTTMELRLTTRRAESLLVILVMPLVLLLFFGSSDLLPPSDASRIAYLTPGIMALAIMSTGLVSLGIATAYERHYGVLKRLGGTPLTSGHLVAAKISAVGAIEIVQVSLIGFTAAVVFNWQPRGSLVTAVAVAMLGTVAFAGLGLALAGGLRAEAVLAVANGLYIAFLLLGGFFLPLAELPPALAAVAAWLPAAAFAELLRSALNDTPLSGMNLLVLTAWAVASVVLATRFFRWD